jgi:hypothetical protein
VLFTARINGELRIEAVISSPFIVQKGRTLTSTSCSVTSMVLLVTYDLNKTKDYEAVYSAIKSLGNWVRDPNLDSVWFVSTNYSVEQAYNVVRAATDSDDRLFVTRLRSGEYTGWMNLDIWPWISARL